MALRGHANIPRALASLGTDVVSFFQGLLDYEHQLIQTGQRIHWKSTSSPKGNFLKLDGSTITNSDYPALVAYAANDADFTVGATTTDLPTESGYWVKT